MNLFISLSSKYNNKTIDMNSDNIKYKPETVSSLAAKYGVTHKTFSNWISKIKDDLDIKRKRPLTPGQLKKIIEFLDSH